MANNVDFSDIRKRMRENGFEEIQTVTAYYEQDLVVNRRTCYEEVQFLLFAKPIGNIAILRICGTKYDYEIQNIGDKTLYDYSWCIDDSPKCIQVNAMFINNKGRTFYFMMPYGL